MVQGTRVGFIAIVIFGTIALLTTLTQGVIPPFQMMAMCFSIAFILICLRWIINKENGFRYIRQPLFSWIIGVAGLFGFHFFYFKGMSLAPAVEVSLITYLWPLLIVLFSSFLPGEKLRFYPLIGAVLALVGCWILISGKENGAGFDWNYLTGYLCALGAAISWGLYSPVCQHRPEPLDFEITYKSGQSGAHYAKTSDTDRIQSGAESFLRKTHPSRVYARV